jgi:uncharacterized Ntn-hydrolase superfamily protein
MSWYPTQTNALYVTEDIEQKSTEYVDSEGRHFIDVDDVVVDHKTVNGYVTVDEDSGLPIYNPEPHEETTDIRVKDSWSSIVDRFSVHDIMNMHYLDSIDFDVVQVHTNDPIESVVNVPVYNIGYDYKKVLQERQNYVNLG